VHVWASVTKGVSEDMCVWVSACACECTRANESVYASVCVCARGRV